MGWHGIDLCHGRQRVDRRKGNKTMKNRTIFTDTKGTLVIITTSSIDSIDYVGNGTVEIKLDNGKVLTADESTLEVND